MGLPKSSARARKMAAKQLYSLPGVDVVGVHYYRQDFASLKEFIDIDIQVARELGKSFYVGELGAKRDSPNRPVYYHDEVQRWKDAGAFSVMPWQIDSSGMDVGVSDEFGFARWRDGDYQGVVDTLKTVA